MNCEVNQQIYKCHSACFDGIHHSVANFEYVSLGVSIYVGEHCETDVEVLVFYHFISSFMSSFFMRIAPD